MGVLSNYEPKEALYYFEELTKIPRATYNCKPVSDYCMKFAKDLGLECYQDEAYNVVIKKPGTPGYENAEPVIMQGHLDLVAVKTEDSTHDFTKDPLELFVEDGKIGAKNTSLGGDDGVAIAITMAVLASKDIPHPPIEALFTADEEQSMNGAKTIGLSRFKGKMVMNLDGEEEGEFVVGCAGGFICRVHIPYTRVEETGCKVTVSIKGLTGGHSGCEIQKQLGNSNKLMGRVLNNLAKDLDFNIVDINGGSAANVISQFTTAELIVEPEHAEELVKRFEAFEPVLKAEYAGDEDGMVLKAVNEGEATVQAIDADATNKIIAYLFGAPDEVQAYDRSFREYVETSLNTGILKTEDGNVWAEYQVRSSVKSKLDAMKEKMTMWAELVGGWIEIFGDYPAWAYKEESRLHEIMVKKYVEMYGQEPSVYITHGGLEGGMFSEKNPELDIVCFGPNLYDVHSVNERVGIESFKRTYEFILEVLKECK
ncbi:MAG: aminoacyl-histidine dipeptidase [Dorea sp.]